MCMWGCGGSGEGGGGGERVWRGGQKRVRIERKIKRVCGMQLSACVKGLGKVKNSREWNSECCN